MKLSLSTIGRLQ